MKPPIASLLIGILLAACLGTGGTPSAWAEDTPEPFLDQEIVPEQELDALRGGFASGNEFRISFGIEKAVYVNGVLEATRTLHFEPGRAGSLSLPDSYSGNLGSLVRVGPGNTIAPATFDKFQSGFFTLVQNSLDRQVIQNITRINVEMSALGMLREMSLSEALNRQLIRSIR